MSTKPDPNHYVLFWDHIISPSNPHHLAVFSQWFDSPFIDPYNSNLTADSPSTSRNELHYSSSNPSPDANKASTPAPLPIIYATTEHWMMYHKALLFDPPSGSAILAAPTPAEAQRLGREIPNFNREIWAREADGIVQRGNRAKFHPGSAPPGGGDAKDAEKDALARKRWETLRGTKGKRMVEASPKDRVWGIGFGVEDALDHVEEWGLNRMGDALTGARAELLEELDGEKEDPVPDH